MNHLKNHPESLVNLALFESIRQNKPNTFYLDHFVLLLLSLIPEKKQKITSIEIQKLFKDHLLMDIPLTSVNNISNRAIKNSYFQKDQKKPNYQNLANNTYSLKNEKIQKENKRFNKIREKIKKNQENFYLEFQKFILEKYQVQLELQKCKEIFQLHFIKYYKNITDIDSCPISTIYNEEYVVSDFIFHLYKIKNDKLLMCLEEIIRGNWISNYLFMWGGDSYKKNLKGVSVFLDTPLIISLLGFHGKLQKKITTELIELLNNLGAKTYVFSHNIDETKNVLKYWATSVKKGNFRNLRFETVKEIKDKSYDSQRLESLAISLKSSLVKLQIKEYDDPTILKEYRIDEKKLENYISHTESNYTGNKVYIDIKSAIFIFALREGKVTLNITDNPHIFTSSTYKVVSGINDFFKEEYPVSTNKNIPIFTMQNWLTNLCWISNPKKTFLSRDVLISNSYASLNTDSQFWELVQEKLQTLEKQQNIITEEGIDTIRYEEDFKHCVEEHFVLSNKEIETDDIHDLIKKAKQKTYKSYEEKVKKLNKDKEKIAKNIKLLSKYLGHIIAILIGFIIVILIIGLFYLIQSLLLSLASLIISIFGIKYKYKEVSRFFSIKIDDLLNQHLYK